MRKILFFILFSGPLMLLAQRGNNQFIPAFEFGLPVGSFSDFNPGIGISGKALFGFGEHAQAGVYIGYSAFKLEGSTSENKTKLSTLPIMLAYRYKLPVIYLEPQLGYGVYTTTVKTEVGNTSNKSTTSNGGFTWSLGGGVQIGSVDLGVRYQSGHPSGGTVGLFGIHAGYIFRSRKS